MLTKLNIHLFKAILPILNSYLEAIKIVEKLLDAKATWYIFETSRIFLYQKFNSKYLV